MAHSVHNIERLAGKPYYTGYANVAGQMVVYRIRNLEGLTKPGMKWRGGPLSLVNGKAPPTVYGKTLAEVSAALDKLSED